MTDLEQVISHLQIIWTWAELDGNMGRGMEPMCCLRVAEWVDEALELLKEYDHIRALKALVLVPANFGEEADGIAEEKLGEKLGEALIEAKNAVRLEKTEQVDMGRQYTRYTATVKVVEI